MNRLGRAINAFITAFKEDQMDITDKDIQDNTPLSDCGAGEKSEEKVEAVNTDIKVDSTTISEKGEIEKDEASQGTVAQHIEKANSKDVIYNLEKEDSKDCGTEDIPHTKDSTAGDADTKDDNVGDTDNIGYRQTNESKTKMDTPDVRLKTSLSLGEEGYVTGLSIQGRSHIQDGTECQDYHYFENLGEGWLLAIVSDGAGSAREAARGSKANCELASQMIKRLLSVKKWKETSYFPTEKEWHIEIANIFEIIQSVINRSAASQAASYKKEQEEQIARLKLDLQRSSEKEKAQIAEKLKSCEKNASNPLQGRDFNATLIVLLKSPKGMMTAHIGDGRMGYLSKEGEWHSLMTPHKGDEASSTVFIPSNWNRQMEIPAFTMKGAYLPDTRVVVDNPKAFVLMSDGCESFSWNCTAYDKEKEVYYDRNTPFDKFLNPLIEYLNSVNDLEQRVDDMIDIINIGTVGGRREVDDRTMLLWVSETSQN
ncbi:MAG: protein phosphatase 2C domain-containing protein [Muribaculum sp.]|nr:protein phosphatase 2C domain-containing protein [Muribaculum sp.]